MNEYKISNLCRGMKESFLYEVTHEKLETFMRLTGDNNPLHTNNTYAVNHGFKGKVVYGMLTASLISTMGGCYLPGKYCLIQSVEIKFAKPVYVDDVLNVIGEVNKIDVDLRYVEIKVSVLNQNNEKVLRGILKARVIADE